MINLIKLTNQLSTLPKGQILICNVYNRNGDKLINHEKGRIVFTPNNCVLETSDGSGDFIEFYEKMHTLFARYVIMGGDEFLNEPIGRITFKVAGSEQEIDFKTT